MTLSKPEFPASALFLICKMGLRPSDQIRQVGVKASGDWRMAHKRFRIVNLGPV